MAYLFFFYCLPPTNSNALLDGAPPDGTEKILACVSVDEVARREAIWLVFFFVTLR